MQNRVLKYSALSGVLLSVIGCGSSNDEAQPQVSAIEVLNVSDAKLVRPGAKAVERVIKNGLMASQIGVNYSSRCTNCPVDAVAESATSDADGDFSQTTTQENGVDESDRVKYDGSTLYIASNNYGGYYTTLEEGSEPELSELPHVRVLERNEDDSLTEASLIGLDEYTSSVDDLYVEGDRLAVLYAVNEPYETVDGNQQGSTEPALSDYWLPIAQKYGVAFHDVSNKQQIQALAEYTIDGYVTSSRRIGNKVYVVSSFYNYVNIYTDSEGEEAQTVYEQLLQDDEIKLLPEIEVAGEKRQLVTLEQCYMPAETPENYGYSVVTTMVTFDLEQPNSYQAECVIAPVDQLYASTDGMYFYSSYWASPELVGAEASGDKVVMHHFTYTADSIAYQATGKINGHVGWQNSHLRFSEKDGYLRVVSTDRDETGDFDHKLFVLESDAASQELTVVAHLPNDLHTQKIGKPGEDVYAVRYFGDKAYVVTFERRDPLYVIDLTNPVNPVIEGELDIPGYSAYLQPLNDRYLVGVGQQVDPNLFNGQVSDTASQIEEGAKIELYDVSDPNNPVVAATLVFSEKYSPVEWDYHALTQLKVTDDVFKFALPISGWEKEPQGDGYVWNYINEMKLVNIDLSATEKMWEQGGISVDTDYGGSWGDRAVLHGDLVYYIRHNDVWQSWWSQPSVVNGPY